MGDVIKMQIANFQISHGIIDVATDTRVKSDLCTFNIRLTGGLCEYHRLWTIGRKIALFKPFLIVNGFHQDNPTVKANYYILPLLTHS